jgi:hypothetical protein
MIFDKAQTADPRNKDVANYDSTDKSDDTLNENKGDAALAKGNEPGTQDKPDDPLVKTVTPDNDNGDPGPSTEPVTNSSAEQPITNSSNKGQGPAGENL